MDNLKDFLAVKGSSEAERAHLQFLSKRAPIEALRNQTEFLISLRDTWRNYENEVSRCTDLFNTMGIKPERARTVQFSIYGVVIHEYSASLKLWHAVGLLRAADYLKVPYDLDAWKEIFPELKETDYKEIDIKTPKSFSEITVWGARVSLSQKQQEKIFILCKTISAGSTSSDLDWCEQLLADEGLLSAGRFRQLFRSSTSAGSIGGQTRSGSGSKWSCPFYTSDVHAILRLAKLTNQDQDNILQRLDDILFKSPPAEPTQQTPKPKVIEAPSFPVTVTIDGIEMPVLRRAFLSAGDVIILGGAETTLTHDAELAPALAGASIMHDNRLSSGSVIGIRGKTYALAEPMAITPAARFDA